MNHGQAHSRTLNLPSALASTLVLSFLLSLLLVPPPLRGQQPGSGEDVNAWKYKHLAVVVHNSGSHRPTALYCIDVLNQLARIKPPPVSVSLFGFEEEFQQLEGGRFARKVRLLLPDTTSAAAMREAADELVFRGPSPVYDAVGAALNAATEHPKAAVLLLSNAIDNASAASFKDLARRAKKTGVPILAVYLPANPPQKGPSRMRRLAKVSGGRFIEASAEDAWQQLLAALR